MKRNVWRRRVRVEGRKEAVRGVLSVRMMDETGKVCQDEICR